MHEPRQKYNEPIFYFNPDGNCFLDARFITESYIVLDPQSPLPHKQGKIEFSFPNCDYVISCDFDLMALDDESHYLRFKNLKNEDRKFLSDFILEKKYSTEGQADSEALF